MINLHNYFVLLNDFEAILKKIKPIVPDKLSWTMGLVIYYECYLSA
jgi:hypothetical protein